MRRKLRSEHKKIDAFKLFVDFKRFYPKVIATRLYSDLHVNQSLFSWCAN